MRRCMQNHINRLRNECMHNTEFVFFLCRIALEHTPYMECSNKAKKKLWKMFGETKKKARVGEWEMGGRRAATHTW